MYMDIPASFMAFQSLIFIWDAFRRLLKKEKKKDSCFCRMWTWSGTGWCSVFMRFFLLCFLFCDEYFFQISCHVYLYRLNYLSFYLLYSTRTFELFIMYLSIWKKIHWRRESDSVGAVVYFDPRHHRRLPKQTLDQRLFCRSSTNETTSASKPTPIEQNGVSSISQFPRIQTPFFSFSSP